MRGTLAFCTAGALALAVGCSSGTSDTGSTGGDTADQADVTGGGGDTGGGTDTPDGTEVPGDATDAPDSGEQIDVADPEDVPETPDTDAPDTDEPPDTSDVGDTEDPTDVGDPSDTTDVGDTTEPLACGAIGELAFPGEVSGETFEAAASTLGIEPEMCPGNLFSATGGASPDNVWAFTAPEDGAYEFTLAPSNTFDSALYVLTDCTPTADTCLGSDDGYGKGTPEVVTVTLTAHQTVFVVADGWTGAAEAPPAFGAYTLSVKAPCVPQCDGKTCGADGCGGDCGVCDPGAGCNAAGTACEAVGAACKAASTIECGQSVDLLDNTSAAAATAAFDSYPCQLSSQDLYSGNEVTVAFTAPAGAPTKVTVSGANTIGVDLIVLADDGAGCALGNGNCVTSGFSGADFTATPGSTYYFVWDAPDYADSNSSFGMAVECCTPSCGGKSCGDDGCGGSCGSCETGYCTSAGACAAPVSTCVSQGEIVCGGSLTGLSSDAPGLSQAFDSYTCQLFVSDDFSGPELVYSFKPLVDQRVTLSTTKAGGFAITLLEDSGSGCSDAEGFCVGHGYGSVTADVVAGKTYYVTLDSYEFEFGASPAHEIGLATECCVPSCTVGTCGDDGCGGTCGCGASEVCTAGVCGAAAAGEVCATAIDLGIATQTITAVGDTTAASDDFVDGCSAPGKSFNSGAASDLVYSFTAGPAGDYSFALTNGADGPYQLSVLADCEAFECLDGYDYYFGGEPLLVTLEAGVTYFVVVDSGASAEFGQFTFSITPPAPIP
jgi:hypothetical protein